MTYSVSISSRGRGAARSRQADAARVEASEATTRGHRRGVAGRHGIRTRLLVLALLAAAPLLILVALNASEDLATAREARRVIAGLRPTVLDDFGLGTAIHFEVEALRAEGWQAVYEAELGEERLPPTIETALFRVAQEALTNVRKHAGRTRVVVSLRRVNGQVRLAVRDWGRGFAVRGSQNGAGPGERVGLLGMRERVMLLAGTVTVESQPGDGTTVIAEVPLAASVPAGVIAGSTHGV